MKYTELERKFGENKKILRIFTLLKNSSCHTKLKWHRKASGDTIRWAQGEGAVGGGGGGEGAAGGHIHVATQIIGMAHFRNSNTLLNSSQPSVNYKRAKFLYIYFTHFYILKKYYAFFNV
jgi:hypothetical protein